MQLLNLNSTIHAYDPVDVPSFNSHGIDSTRKFGRGSPSKTLGTATLLMQRPSTPY